MATLTQINIYPIKSMAGIALSSAYVSAMGLAFDRQLMLVDDNGKFVTARKYPQLLSFSVVLQESGVVICGAKGKTLVVNYSDFSQITSVNIWRHEMVAKTACNDVNLWLSNELGISVRLVSVADESIRKVKNTNNDLAFADGYPLLIIGEESLIELNNRAEEPSLMSQFRTNLVFDGEVGFIEDTWRRIKIGDVEFEFVKPCERCVMTTVDMTTYHFRTSKEPLATLKTFRADPRGRLMFGENLIAINQGLIRVGDKVEVLETHQGVFYGAK